MWSVVLPLVISLVLTHSNDTMLLYSILSIRYMSISLVIFRESILLFGFYAHKVEWPEQHRVFFLVKFGFGKSVRFTHSTGSYKLNWKFQRQWKHLQWFYFSPHYQSLFRLFAYLFLFSSPFSPCFFLFFDCSIDVSLVLRLLIPQGIFKQMNSNRCEKKCINALVCHMQTRT